jgi:hypothetical protein
MSTNTDEVKYQLDAPAAASETSDNSSGDAASACLTTETLDSKSAYELIHEELEKLKNLSQAGVNKVYAISCVKIWTLCK